MADRKIRIVYIMEDCPAYDLYGKDNRPSVNWDTSGGSWVGIWGYDWGNQLGDFIMKNSDRFTFEVRQPDLRADRIYEHRFENGTVHKIYPAAFNNTGKFVYSDVLIKDLTGSENNSTIIHTGVTGRFTASFLERLKVKGRVGSFHSEIILPIDNLFTLRKNVINYRRVFSDHMKFKRLVNRFDVITYQTSHSLDKLTRYYSGKLERATMGADFSKFVKMDKSGCRKELNLPADARILISVGRINNIKGQADVVKELTKMIGSHKFLYVVLGHGLKADDEILKSLSAPLSSGGQILFPGYVRNERLVKYLNASDVFLMASASEAGPVASMEAVACELPIITMDTGSVCEFLKSSGSGVVVERNDYTGFAKAIMNYLNGAEIKTADREAARELFDWNSTAKKFIEIYNGILNESSKTESGQN